MRHIESRIQSTCVRWHRLQYPHITIFAIPNGGRRGKLEASIMKGEGVLAGVADVFIMRPRNGQHGIFIEFKTDKGRQTPEQKAFEEQCERLGYEYHVVRSFDTFRTLIEL